MSYLQRRLFLAIAALAMASSARADVTITSSQTQSGGTLSVTPAGALIVNNSTNPLLTLSNGAATSGVQAAIIGNNSKGDLLVNGGSVLTNSGDGSLLGVYGSSSVYRGGGYLGLNAGSTGAATVTGSGSQWNNTYLNVGLSGTGTLAITDGGTVSSIGGVVGYFSGSNGSVTVGGGTGNSVWANLGDLFVGISGTGTLTITTGGLVSAASLNGGNATSSVKFDGGTLRITATDSASNTISLLSGGGTLDVPTAGSTFTVTGAISGAGGLAKTGAGTMTLSGTNSYSGGTTISGGTLSGNTIANNGTNSAFGKGNFAINNGGTLQYTGLTAATNRTVSLGSGGGTINVSAAGTTLTDSGVISGAGGLTKTGAGTLTLTGSNTYTGPTTISGGKISFATTARIGNDSPIGRSSASNASDVILSNGGGFTYTGPSAGFYDRRIFLDTGGGAIDIQNAATLFPINREISGSGGLTKEGAGILQFDAANTYSGPTNIAAGELRLSGSEYLSDSSAMTIQSGALFNMAGYNETIGSLAGAGNVAVGSNGAVLTVGGDNTTTHYSGQISGVGRLYKTGAGTMYLDGTTNSYQQRTTIAGGTLSGSFITNNGMNSSFGRFSIEILNAATLEYTGASVSTNRQIELGTGGGTIGVSNPATTLAFTGDLNGAGSLTKSGSGTLKLDGANSYGGATNINLGTLMLGASERIPDASAMTVASGGTFNLNNFSETIGSLAGSGNVTLGGGTLTMGGNNQSTSFSGAITGSGSLVKTGSGVFTHTGTSSYSGYTTVEAGTLAITSGGSVLNSNSYIGNDSGSNGTVNVGGGMGGSSWANSGQLIVGNYGTGMLNITGGGSVTDTTSYIGFTASSNGTVNVGDGMGNSTWTNSGTLYVGTQGKGTLAITGGGNVSSVYGFIGAVAGSNGTVTVGGGTGDATWTIARELHVGDSGKGTLNIDTGGLVAARSLDGGNAGSSVNFDGGTLRITASDSASNTINLNAGGGTLDVPTAGSTFTVTSNIGGPGGLTKTGAGTVALSGSNNTYAGATKVNEGTLALVAPNNTITNNNIASSPTILVAAGAKLDVRSLSNGTLALAVSQTIGGNGTIEGGLSVGDGSFLSPGNSPGTLVVTGNTNWDSGGHYTWEINNASGAAGTDWDLAKIGEALSITTSGGNPFFLIDIMTLSGLASGMMANFNSTLDYAWLIADSGLVIDSFSADKFKLNLAGFKNSYGGTFGIARGDAVSGGDNSQIYITYSGSVMATPEAWNVVTVAIMAAMLGLYARARSRAKAPAVT